MIRQGFPRHNVHGTGRGLAAVAAVLILLGIALAGAGCRRQDAAPEPAAAPVETACPLGIDLSVWREFERTGQRILAGEKLSREEMGTFATLPVTEIWTSVQGSSTPITTLNLTNWMEEAFRAELQIEGNRKVSANRRTMSLSYRYSFEHRAEIDSLLDLFAAEDSRCELRTLLERWIDPRKIPDDLVIAFLPAKPEIRAADDLLLVDTGLLAAGGLKQTRTQIAALAYRWLEIGQRPDPTTLEGEDAMAGTLVKIRDEGIAAWIGNRPFTFFRTDHPSLGEVNIVPESYLKTAGMAIVYADSNLPGIFADPDRMAAEAFDFPRRMSASGAFTSLGYVMAATIAGQLSEERLIEAAPTVSDFFAAYQEAAALNPVPRPAPGAKGYPWYASMAPFSPELAANFQELLTARGL